MTEHTPGPWQWGAHPTEDITQLYVSSVDGIELALADVYEVANVRLMAAAPELLAACEAVLAMEPHLATCEGGEDCATCRDLTLRALDLAEAAMRKVRGEQP